MRLTGKLYKPSDLVELIVLLSSKKKEGCVVLSFLHPFREVKFCVKDGKVYFDKVDELPPQTYLKILIEDWLLSKRHPYFKVLENVVCGWNSYVTVDEFREILSEEYLEKIFSLPREFIVEKVEGSVPKFLRAVQLAKKPVTLDDLHLQGISWLDFARWRESGLVVVRPFKERWFISTVLNVSFVASLLFALFLLVLPDNYVRVFITSKRNSIMNEILAEKVVGRDVDELTIPGCKGKVRIKGKDVFLDTVMGRYLVGQIPEKGYVPFFEVPAK
jgi:hypothetical protein